MDIEGFYHKSVNNFITNDELNKFIIQVVDFCKFEQDHRPHEILKTKTYLCKIISILDKQNVNGEKIGKLSDIAYKLNSIYYLYSKYDYGSYNDLIYNKNIKLSRPSLLVDALFTGYNVPNHHSFSIYNKGIENDIYEIIKLVPSSMFCTYGRVLGMQNMTPLVISCLNHNISTDIIKVLLLNGSDTNNENLSNLDKLLESSSQERKDVIKSMLSKKY